MAGRSTVAARSLALFVASVLIWAIAPVGPANAAVATMSSSATPTAPVGSVINDTVTITGPTGSPTPTGTVDFTVYPPASPTCTGATWGSSFGRPLIAGVVPTATATSGFSGSQGPTTPGTYRWVAVYSGDANYAPVTSPCGGPGTTSVLTQAQPTLTTSATPNGAVGFPITDTATVTGAPAPVPAPSGTVTFTLFGPNNPTCTGPPVFSSPNRPLSGTPSRATSGPFTPTAVGTYRWVAAYSGDANHTPVTSPCNAPNETSVVDQGQPTIVTNATPQISLGWSIYDVATVTGAPAPAPAPTGTVTFYVFGPGDLACSGPPYFTSINPLGGTPPPTASSSTFTPTAVGTYQWVAIYNGDANYPPVTSPCGSPGETSVVNQAQPYITSQATPSAILGQPISDTATVRNFGGFLLPTGTVTFSVFGPNDPICTGSPVFTNSNRPLSGNPSTAASSPFTPTAPGTYRWTVSYSGDADHNPATSACNDSNETSVVTEAGQLRVTTSPALPSQILLDGVPRDSFGLSWLKLAPGTYTLSFTHVEGWTEPAPQTVTVSPGAVTTVTGTFTRRGTLRVVTNPALPGTISVDGVPRDNWGMFTDLPTGGHQVCFGQVAGFDPPGCQTVSLFGGAQTLVTGNYVANALAPGPANVGELRATSSPAVSTQILVDGIPRDSWGLSWLKLAPGMYTVSFTHVEGWTEPAPAIVTVTAGAATTVTGTFIRRGVLEVKTSPARPGTISVDGIPRNDWGMFTDLPTGAHQVCFGPVPGSIAPPCTAATLSAGAKTTVTGNYT